MPTVTHNLPELERARKSPRRFYELRELRAVRAASFRPKKHCASVVGAAVVRAPRASCRTPGDAVPRRAIVRARDSSPAPRPRHAI